LGATPRVHMACAMGYFLSPSGLGGNG
jgi:hypothetical protein